MVDGAESGGQGRRRSSKTQATDALPFRLGGDEPTRGSGPCALLYHSSSNSKALVGIPRREETPRWVPHLCSNCARFQGGRLTARQPACAALGSSAPRPSHPIPASTPFTQDRLTFLVDQTRPPFSRTVDIASPGQRYVGHSPLCG